MHLQLAVALTPVARPTHATARNKQPKTVKTCRIVDVECIGKLLERHTHSPSVGRSRDIHREFISRLPKRHAHWL